MFIKSVNSITALLIILVCAFSFSRNNAACKTREKCTSNAISAELCNGHLFISEYFTNGMESTYFITLDKSMQSLFLQHVLCNKDTTRFIIIFGNNTLWWTGKNSAGLLTKLYPLFIEEDFKGHRGKLSHARWVTNDDFSFTVVSSVATKNYICSFNA